MKLCNLFTHANYQVTYKRVTSIENAILKWTTAALAKYHKQHENTQIMFLLSKSVFLTIKTWSNKTTSAIGKPIYTRSEHHQSIYRATYRAIRLSMECHLVATVNLISIKSGPFRPMRTTCVVHAVALHLFACAAYYIFKQHLMRKIYTRWSFTTHLLYS